MNATCSSRSSTLSVVRPPSEAQRPSQSRGSPPVLFRALGGATNQRYAGRGGPRPSLLVRCSQRKPDAHPHVSPRAEDPWEETWARGEHTSTQAAAHLNCCRMVQNCPCPALGAGRCALPWCRGAAPGAAPRSTHQQQSPEGGARAHDTGNAARTNGTVRCTGRDTAGAQHSSGHRGMECPAHPTPHGHRALREWSSAFVESSRWLMMS